MDISNLTEVKSRQSVGFKFPSRNFEELPAVPPSFELSVRRRKTSEGKFAGLERDVNNANEDSHQNHFGENEDSHQNHFGENEDSHQNHFGEELVKLPRGATAAARMVTKEWDATFPDEVAVCGSTPMANVQFGLRLPSHILPETPPSNVARIRINDKQRLLRNRTIDKQREILFRKPDAGNNVNV